jgi:membrane associated rhomboid family serine protease
MFPLRDNAAPRRLTLVNMMLIAANVAVFFYEASLGPAVEPFIESYALVPAALSSALHLRSAEMLDPSRLWPIATIFTAMFLHGGFWHIAGNMLYLFIFGAAVEWRMGSLRYLLFYFFSGTAAAIATVLITPGSAVPVIGASGAIAGVLGAYFIFFPRGKILTILPIFIFIQFIEVPAVLYLLLWFALQLYSGLSEGSRGAMMGGVAWWAHVGGFLFGLALAPLIADERPARRRVAYR